SRIARWRKLIDITQSQGGNDALSCAHPFSRAATGRACRMLPLDTLTAFFGIAVLLALTPGPDNLFVLMQSALWGRRAGFLVVLGLCTGLLGHTAAVAVGLAAVFAASPLAFHALKIAGAAYLLYLAWQVL